MKAGWIIPFIILGGALQSAGAAMNGQLKNSLVNPYLASAISFALITFLFAGLFFIMPHPLPTTASIAGMPWWAPIGGLVGALQVYMGLTQVNKGAQAHLQALPSLPPSLRRSSLTTTASYAWTFTRSTGFGDSERCCLSVASH